MSEKIIKTIGKTLNTISVLAPRFASKKALNLFATPRKGRYTNKQMQLIDSATLNTLEYEGLEIAVYYWTGNETAKTILLVHGWESNASRWHYLLEPLREEGYNIVAIDAPAHGKSGGKQFNAVLYSECINVVAQRFKPNVLIGHSVGGMASIFALYNHKMPFVKKLVSLGSPAHFTGVFLRYKKMMGYNNKIANGLDALVLERFNKPVTYFSAADFVSTFNIEGLIIHDKNDAIIPYNDGALIAEKFKNSKFITTRDFGHKLIDDSITPKIIKFINS